MTISSMCSIAKNVVPIASAHPRAHAHPVSMATLYSVAPVSHVPSHRDSMGHAVGVVPEPRVPFYHALIVQKSLIITHSCSVAGAYSAQDVSRLTTMATV